MSSRTPLALSARLVAAAAGCLLAVALLPVAPVRAGVVITVSSIADATTNDGQCSLREAIMAANADSPVYGAPGECPGGSGTDTIRFPAGVDWHLESQLPAITSSMTIDGGDQATLTATGGGDGLFRQTGGTVLIQRMRILDTVGTVVSKAGGSLTLSGVNINGITGDVAIANTAGSITIKGSTISSNTSPGISGGGFYNAGTATILESTFNGNTSVLGGGVYNVGALTVMRTEFSLNSALNGLFSYGGGALVNHGTATIGASTFTNNTSDHPGGAIANFGTLTMVNDTLVNNYAGGASSGGAIYNTGTMTLVNGTVTLNGADASGDGIWTDYGKSTVLKNTIVSGNASGNGETDLGGASLGAGSTHNVTGAFADLGTFLDANGAQDNGGPTATVEIYRRTGSPFIDKGSSSVCASTLVGSRDQRGVTRPSACDIGAVELERSVPSMTGAPTAGLRSGTTLIGTSMPARISFAAKDNSGGSGVERYVLSRSVNGGSWSTLASGIPTAAWNLTLTNGATYRFRVRAVDYDGNISSWIYGSTFKASLVQQTSSAVTFSSGWFTRTSTLDSGGSSRYASSGGRSVKITFTGRAIALVSFRSNLTGLVKVYVDGTYSQTVSTNAGDAYRALVWTKRWSTGATHSIQLVVATGSTVYVDAFAILK